MGYYSQVTGSVSFERVVKEDEATRELREQREAIAAQLAALGGTAVFKEEEVFDAFLAVLRDDQRFDNLNYFFAIDEDGMYAEGESAKAYNLEDEVRDLASLANEHNVQVDGIITVEGEENSDIWRLVIKENVVVKEEASIRWPDGSKYQG